MAAAQYLRYGNHQRIGRLMVQWLELPKSSLEIPKCPVQSTDLKLGDLTMFERLDIEFDQKPKAPIQLEGHLGDLNTAGPEDGSWHKYCLEQLDTKEVDRTSFSYNPEEARMNVWEGQTAPGVIFIEEIKRKTGPYASRISQTMYEENFPMETLKHVYMVDVQNEDTRDFVNGQIYTEANGLVEQEEEITKSYEWKYGTPEFEGLLGTQLGRHVAFLLLGAFERGTHRVTSIKTWFAFQELQMQFVIGEAPVVIDLEKLTGLLSSRRSKFTASNRVVLGDSVGISKRSKRVYRGYSRRENYSVSEEPV